MYRRREFIGFFAATTSIAAFTHRIFAQALTEKGDGLRGGLDAIAFRPASKASSGSSLQKMIDQTARENVPLFLPPGNYHASNLVLPDNTRITGVPGASRLVYSGDGALLTAQNAKRIELSNITIDGGNRWIGDDAGALLEFNAVDEVLIDNCEIGGSHKHAVQMERCGGRIERSHITGAGQSAIYAVDSAELSISGNTITSCGNGGILVHRWKKGSDGTIVSGNRISGIAATDGGTGQNGNGVNIFRADNVMVSGNHVSDCAFTAIRANSASDIQISDNQCLRSGETAIYCEFEFEGAIVSGNLIDGAANGISIVNFNEGGRMATVSGNLVRNLTLAGPYKPDVSFGVGICAEADTLVSNNVVEGAPFWALQIGWGPYLRNVLVSGNIIRKSTVGCVVSVVEGAGTAVIADNIFQDVSQGAVLGYRWDKRTTGELAAASDTGYAHLTVDRNRVS